MSLLLWNFAFLVILYLLLRLLKLDFKDLMLPILLASLGSINHFIIYKLGQFHYLDEITISSYSSIQGQIFLWLSLFIAYKKTDLSTSLAAFALFAIAVNLFGYAFLYVQFGGT